MNVYDFINNYYDDQWGVAMFWLWPNGTQFKDLIALMCHSETDKYVVAWISKESGKVSLKREWPAPNFLQGHAMMQDWCSALQADRQILEAQQ